MAYSLPISFPGRFLVLAFGSLLGLAVPGRAITPDALALRLQQAAPPVLIDLRPTHDFQVAHIPGALNIPVATIAGRKLPPFQHVVLIGDGRGAIDVATAAEALVAKTGAAADILDGGFAAWEDSRRASTRKSGFNSESLPMATYAQVVEGEANVVLVDLRTSSVPALGAAKKARAEKVDVIGADPLDRLASKLPGARRVTDPFATENRGKGKTVRSTASSTPDPGGSVASTAEAGVSPLLVLIDNNDGRAQEVARRLIAQGNRRFVILAGGAEALALEGRSLVVRTGGSINVGGAAQ